MNNDQNEARGTMVILVELEVDQASRLQKVLLVGLPYQPLGLLRSEQFFGRGELFRSSLLATSRRRSRLQ